MGRLRIGKPSFRVPLMLTVRARSRPVKEVLPITMKTCGAFVGTVLSYVEHKRRASSGRARPIDPLTAEILEALVTLGGSAHRQAVADQVCLRRGGRSGPSDSTARDEIYSALDAYLGSVSTRKVAPLLWLPLGTGSYRWALTDAGHSLFQTRSPGLRMVR